MSLQNLKSELVRKGVKQYEVAEFLDMTNSNFAKKLSESIPITREEMYAIRDKYFPNESIDYLFQSDGDEMRRAKPDDGEIAEIEGAFHECVDEWERQYPQEAAETA